MQDDDLRFGVLATERILPAWQARCLEKLDDADRVHLEVVILQQDDGPAAESGGLWERIRRRADGVGETAPVDFRDRLKGVPAVRCRRREGAFGRAVDDDVDRIRAHDLDFILHLGGPPPRGPVLRAARYGIWSFRHGDPNRHPPGPVGFWEIVRDDPVTVGALQRLTTDPGVAEVLHRGRLRTIADSWRQNRDAILRVSSEWPARVCREILAAGRTPESAAPTTRQIAAPRRPGSLDVLRMGWALARNYLTGLVGDLFRHERWSIGTVPHPPQAFLENRKGIWVRWLPPADGRNRYRADPFALSDGDGGFRIMAEEFDYRDRRGRLVTLRAGQDGRTARDPEVVRGFRDGSGAMAERFDLGARDRDEDVTRPRGIPADADSGVHVSYPFLFRHEGEIYCAPETAGARAVRLYRAVRFPDEWELAATLVEDFAAVDSTIFRHGGRWWLFCTDLDQGSHSHLHAWWAPDLFGPWKPHALNPLKVDVQTARPAGPVFRHHDALFRPAQDCSRTYGGGIALNRIMELTPTRFREVPVAYLKPDPDGPYPDGLHTLTGVGGCTLVDGKRRVFVPTVFREQMTKRLRSVFGRLLPGKGEGGSSSSSSADESPEVSPRPSTDSAPRSGDETAAGRPPRADGATSSST